jgi:hypothetical protein
MIRQITYQPKDSEEMKTKWIFRDDGDLSKDYSDFKTLEVLLNEIYDVMNLCENTSATIMSHSKNKASAYWDILDIFDRKTRWNNTGPQDES